MSVTEHVDDAFAGVVAQPGLVAQLRAAAHAPVHAYLLVGNPGAGAATAAQAFAAALLCADGGCGHCRDCRLALAGEHPDLLLYTPQGASMLRKDGEAIVAMAVRSPLEGARKVLVLNEMHRISVIAPMLLKTIEEPPASAVFVLLADHVPPELVTIASRCVRIEVPSITAATLEQVLRDEGTDASTASVAAGAAGGSLDRARLLVHDPGLAARHEQWSMVPRRLDGTGAAVIVVIEELLQTIQDAMVPLAERQAVELAELEERVAAYGERGSGRGALEALHKREQRRHRAEELRLGLATLAGVYRQAIDAGRIGPASVVAAVAALDTASEALLRNPNERLLLQHLFLRLPSLSG